MTCVASFLGSPTIFYNAEVYFSRLKMLAAHTVLGSGFLASYWSSGIDPFFPLVGGLCRSYANAGGK
jgi:hypothetical protein